MVYEFKIPGLFKVSAQTAGEVCAELDRSAQGLSPAALLEASRDKDAPLHGAFEWNDATAAEKYRLTQARMIIDQLVLVSVEEGVKRVDRAFVNTRADSPVGTYTALETALRNDKLREEQLRTARREMGWFLAKYERMKELAAVVEAMQDTMTTLPK